MTGTAGGTQQDGSVAVRGISLAESNPFGDEAVPFNIDGVQVARGLVRRPGSFDLKGTQALFFGKIGPDGIISVRVADPASYLEAKASAGYEFTTREIQVQGYISGPLTETLGARLVFYGTHMRGWEANDYSDDSIMGRKTNIFRKQGSGREIMLCATFKFGS